MIIKWKTLGFTPKEKQITIPDHATNIRTEWGGWYSDRDIYLWWKEYGNDKCKKLVSTNWRSNLKSFRIELAEQALKPKTDEQA